MKLLHSAAISFDSARRDHITEAFAASVWFGSGAVDACHHKLAVFRIVRSAGRADRERRLGGPWR
jgi:hypothetical protein